MKLPKVNKEDLEEGREYLMCDLYGNKRIISEPEMSFEKIRNNAFYGEHTIFYGPIELGE